jgi:hypothetical protein
MQHEVKSNPLHKDPKDAALLSAEWAAKGEPAERVSPRGLDRGSGVFDREEEAVDDDMETVQKGFLVMIQTGVTLGFAPLATLFMLTVIGDCVITSPHLYGRDSGPEKSKSMLQFINMIIFPAMSFFMSAYMMVAFWMDKSAWTMLRRCIMFANVPMICFYGLILMGQSDAHTFGTTCEFRGFLLQVVRNLTTTYLITLTECACCTPCTADIFTDEHVAHDDRCLLIPEHCFRDTKISRQGMCRNQVSVLGSYRVLVGANFQHSTYVYCTAP